MTTIEDQQENASNSALTANAMSNGPRPERRHPPSIAAPRRPSPRLQAHDRKFKTTSNNRFVTTGPVQEVEWSAGVVAAVTNYGVSCSLSCLRPKVVPGDMSIIFTFVSNDDPSHPEQAIFAGWTRAPSFTFSPDEVDPDLCQLVVYFSVTGQTSDAIDYVAGYCDEVKGWEQTPGAFRPGVSVIPASHINGPQGFVDLKFQLVGDRWNLQMNGNVIGYYPTSLFTLDMAKPGSPPLADPSKTLADHATKAGFFGMVFDMSSGITSTDMGSGKHPEEGFRRSASISKMQYQPLPTAQNPTMADADSSWFKLVDDPNRYDCIVSWQTSSLWRSYMYVGGPGCEAAGWSPWESVGGMFGSAGAIFGPGHQVTALSRRAEVTDLFAIGLDGKVYTSWWIDEDWSGFNNDWRLLDWGGSQTFLPESKVAAVARSQDNLDIFAIGADFKVYTAWWSEGHDWTGWRDISGGQVFGPLPLIAAVSRMVGQLDVFVANVGAVSRTSWTDSVTDWTSVVNNSWEFVGSLDFPGQVSLLVLLRTPQTMDVVVSSTFLGSSSVQWRSWSEGTWQGFAFDSLGNAPVNMAGPRVVGVSRTSDRIDLFALGDDATMYTSHWTSAGGWSGVSGEWESIGDSPPAAAGPMCDIVAVSRTPMSLDVFVAGIDEHVYSNSRKTTVEVEEEGPPDPNAPPKPPEEDSWNGWSSIGGQGFPEVIPYGIAACCRNNQTISLLCCSQSGKFWAAEWLDPGTGPRPFYCIAHNPNSIGTSHDEPAISLQHGANALGPDINRALPSLKLVVSHHGMDGDGWGEDQDQDLGPYLDHIRDLALNNPQLALVVFDCKPSTYDVDAGIQIRAAIREHLTKYVPDLDIIISVAQRQGEIMFQGIKDDLGPREALAIDEDEHPFAVAADFRALGTTCTAHATYGYGHTIQVIPSLRPAIEVAVAVCTGFGGFQAVFEWTDDSADRQAEFIRIGADAVMANADGIGAFVFGGVKTLVDLVNTNLEMRRLVRMATRQDRILEPVNTGYVLIVKTGSTGAGGTYANLTFVVRGTLGVAKKTVGKKVWDASLDSRFQSGATDYVVIPSRDIGNLVDIKVRNDMTGGIFGSSRWRCDSIRVISKRYAVDRSAQFGVDIDSREVVRPLI